MIIWLEDTFGADYAVTIFWIGVALIALIVLLVVWAIVRRVRAGVFVAGGRNRKARLAIMDATKVDDHRHLILVRRDDVEHLLLIGGNSDLVVEADIRPSRITPSTAALDEIARNQARPEPERQQPFLVEEEPMPEIAPTLASRPVQTNLNTTPPPAPRPVAPPPPAPAPVRPAPLAPRPAPPPVAAPVITPVAPPASSVQSELDDDLMRELQSALDLDAPAPTRPAAAPVQSPRPRASLDDEMARLLGELSSQKR